MPGATVRAEGFPVVTSPYRSLTRFSANRKRKLVLSPVLANYRHTIAVNCCASAGYNYDYPASATHDAIPQRQKRNRKRLLYVIGVALPSIPVPGTALPGTTPQLQNAIRYCRSARIIWAITKFPLFYVFGRQLMFFDWLLIVDAVIWGAVLGWALPAFITKQSSRQASV